MRLPRLHIDGKVCCVCVFHYFQSTTVIRAYWEGPFIGHTFVLKRDTSSSATDIGVIRDDNKNGVLQLNISHEIVLHLVFF